MDTKFPTTVYVVIGAFLFFAGVLLGTFADPYLPSSLSNAKKGYEAGFTAARTLVEKSSLGAFFAISPSDMRAVAGKVTAVQGSRLTLHSQTMASPFDKTPALADRTVLVGANTKIIKLIPRDAKMLQAEAAALLKARQTGHATSTAAVQLYTQAVANLADIKAGDSLVVTAGENIKSIEMFTATEIQIQPNLVRK